MKVNISASVEKQVAVALAVFCQHKKDDMIYRRSKSDVINEALKDYLIRKGVVFETH